LKTDLLAFRVEKLEPAGDFLREARDCAAEKWCRHDQPKNGQKTFAVNKKKTSFPHCQFF
jgi:hypothetical protein